VLILTKLDNPRAATIEMLQAVVPEKFDSARVHCSFSANEAVRIARQVTPANGLICVTGSLYLVGAAQQALQGFVVS
jgi:dihydrofolate synthase/folylpolyglutamate synthase